MLRITGIVLATLMIAGPAQAATIGLACDGVVRLVVAPDMDQAGMCAAALPGNCSEGFRVNGGHYAIAQSANGLAQGSSAGYRSGETAATHALSQCESQGDGACAITISGNDDGSSYQSCAHGDMPVDDMMGDLIEEDMTMSDAAQMPPVMAN